MKLWTGISLLAMGPTTAATADTAQLDSLNVVWDSPSEDHRGSMPLGNGEIGLNAWMDRAGDLHFYISRIDSWSEGGHLLKVGKVVVSFEPSLVAEGTEFRQELVLRNGEIAIQTGGANPTNVKLWVDANHPVIHVTSESASPVVATARIVTWRTKPHTPAADSRVSDPYSPKTSVVQPDTILTGYPDRIGWYHHNDESFGFAQTMEFQGLDDYPGAVDILRDRAFGAIVTADGATVVNDTTLTSRPARRQTISVYCLATHPSTPAKWLAAMDEAIREVTSIPFAQRYDAHVAWWREFWNRSWVYITRDENAKTTRRAYPANDLPVFVGANQQGGDQLSAEIGRVAIYPEALDAAQVRALAQLPPQSPSPDWAQTVYSGVPAAHGPLPASEAWDRSPELTIEAWIQPTTDAPAGRIVDKITPGGSDGFLLDLCPPSRVRIINGNTTLGPDEPLTGGEWVHLAAVFGAGGTKLYRNGSESVGEAHETGPDALVVSRGYALQRFINACAGRGRYPIKFNGSIFTVPCEGRDGDADYRQWGPGYWWQNTRLPYVSMCASGDFDLMQPLWRMYVDDLLPLCEFRVHKYFGYDGAYFPECMHPWGAVFPDTYGQGPAWNEREDPLQAAGWHKWEWVSGLELAFMMLDYADYTGDQQFLVGKALPLARSIARFFENYYRTDDAGKLYMHPSQALETWWDVTNPMPEIAGLRAVSERILALPHDTTTAEQREYWTQLLAKLPELPTRETDTGTALAPGQEFAQKSNIENPELYAVFPFRLIGVGRPNLEWGINALEQRWDRGSAGWRQDDIFMAYLGLAEQARENVVSRAGTHDSGSRFPAFWGPNYDWIPDQDHGGVLLKAVQAMIMQVEGDRTYLLPAWPADWNVDFKLHAPRKTTVQASVRAGKITDLVVNPPERRANIIVVGPDAD